MKRRKKLLIEKIKNLHANEKELKEKIIQEYVNKDGVAVIKVYLNKHELFDQFSNPENPDLNPDIFSYIDQETYYIPAIYPVEIKLIGEEKKMDLTSIESHVKEHYWKILADKDQDLKHNKIIYISLFVFGIILYSLYFMFEYAFPKQILFNEIFSVAATFSIWEAVDFGLLQRKSIQIEYFNASQLALAKVTSSTLEEEKNE